MRRLITFVFFFIVAICFAGCTRPKNVTENQINVMENFTKWAEIYQVTLNSYLKQDTALNEGIEFIAIDFSTLEFSNEYDKRAIVTWFEKKQFYVKDINLDGLRKEDLFDGTFISNGIFLTINKITEKNNEIIIEGMKYRGVRAANWFETKWQLNNDIWEFTETVMTSIS